MTTEGCDERGNQPGRTRLFARGASHGYHGRWHATRARRGRVGIARPQRPGSVRYRRRMRRPWHHACFSLRTGEALRAPALDPIACWRVEQRGGTVFVHDKFAPARGAARAATRGQPESVVIIGGGAAGQAAAEMLRREVTDRICQRIISPATHPRNGCRCARPNFTPNTRSCSPSARALWPSMPRPAKYSSPTERARHLGRRRYRPLARPADR